MIITGRTRVAGVIGWPVDHSLSPTLHAAGFASLRLDWAYCAFPVGPDSLAEALRGSRALGLAGLSVTMPHKTQAAALVDRLDNTAGVLNSVNTIEFAADGTLVGHSTDGDGFIASLADEEIQVRDRSVLVLGLGGAGRAVSEALHRSGVRRLVVTNRSGVSRTSLPFAVDVVDWNDRERVLGDVDVIVNCTSLGMSASNDSPIGADSIGDGHVVVDLVYHPSITPLLASASRNGARTVGGIGMLVHQAARQEAIWTGRSPDVAAMKRAVREVLRPLA